VAIGIVCGGDVQFEDLARLPGMDGVARAEASVGGHHAKVLTVEGEGGAECVCIPTISITSGHYSLFAL
jgi:hypothetical protein